MVRNLVRVSAAAVTSLGLVAGVAGMAGASAGTINTTGPKSTASITSNSSMFSFQQNTNHVGALNLTGQQGQSGGASVDGNTTGGPATTGNVANTSMVTTDLSVSNPAPVMPSVSGSADPSGDTGTIENTGPSSSATISTTDNVVSVSSNQNDVGVANVSFQSGQSGNASVKGNTTGGGAATGSVSNSSTVDTDISVTN